MNTLSAPQASQPWWKYPHMWMVVGGPLVVVIASFVSFYLAYSRPDPVYKTLPQVNHTAAGKATLTPVAPTPQHAASASIAPNAPAASAATRIGP